MKMELHARRSQIKSRPKKTRTRQFHGQCWSCTQLGHKRQDCPGTSTSLQFQPAEQGEQYTYQLCCWKCGKLGHLSLSCLEKAQRSKTVEAGNSSRLVKGAHNQLVPRRPASW